MTSVPRSRARLVSEAITSSASKPVDPHVAEAEGLGERDEVGPLLLQQVGPRLALRLVGLVGLLAPRPPRVPGDHHGRGRVVDEHLREHRSEPIDRVGGPPVMGRDRLGQSKERAIGKRIAIDEKELARVLLRSFRAFLALVAGIEAILVRGKEAQLAPYSRMRCIRRQSGPHHRADRRHHLTRPLLHLPPGEAQHPVAACLKLGVTCAVGFESVAIAVMPESIGFHHKPVVEPEEVDLVTVDPRVHNGRGYPVAAAQAMNRLLEFASVDLVFGPQTRFRYESAGRAPDELLVSRARWDTVRREVFSVLGWAS